MPLIGFGVAFLGYSLFYYGLTQVRSGNWGLLDLMVPGKFDATIPTDAGGSAGGSGTSPVAGTPGTGAGQVPIGTQVTPNTGTTSGSAGAGITQTAPGPLA